jgi:hypothetical protein
VNIAYIDYNFDDRQLEHGFSSLGALARPHVAARIDLFGHNFNRLFSLQAIYMRPGAWVTYRDVNGDDQHHHVWFNFGGVTMQGLAPVNEQWSFYGEAGLGIVSRRGFESPAGIPVVRDAHYWSAVVGSGFIYRANAHWNFLGGVTYIPHRPTERQPATMLASLGFRYNVRPLSPETVEAVQREGFYFPKNLVQLELSTGAGYNVNTFFSSKVPIFWGGNVPIDRGAAIHYERNVFHTRKIFALDFGGSLSYWRSQGLHDTFATASVYPLLRFTFLRTEPADLYFMYSFAGPTFISRSIIDNVGTGGRFTFQDFMGFGAFIGKSRNMSVGVKITHYSNGNLFIENGGLRIPLTINLGYAF